MANLLTDVPANFKPIQHYLKTAAEQDSRDPVLAYYCKWVWWLGGDCGWFGGDCGWFGGDCGWFGGDCGWFVGKISERSIMKECEIEINHMVMI